MREVAPLIALTFYQGRRARAGGVNITWINIGVHIWAKEWLCSWQMVHTKATYHVPRLQLDRINGTTVTVNGCEIRL